MAKDWDILQNFAKSLIDNGDGTFSMRTSGGGTASATSAEVSAGDAAVSAQAASAVASEISNRISADNALQAAINVVSNAISAEAVTRAASVQTASAAATSVDERVTSVNTALGNISARSVGNVSTKGLQSVVNALSNRISAVVAGAASVTSAEVQALSDAVTSVDARVNVLSNLLSATGNVNPQVRHRSNVVSVISGANLVDIAGLSVSLAADGFYLVEGFVAFEKATSGGAKFGASVPGLTQGGSYIHGHAQSAPNSQNGGIGTGKQALSAMATGQTVITSVSVTTVDVLRFFEFRAALQMSATGSFQLMAGGSVANDSISIRGGYIRAYRIA